MVKSRLKAGGEEVQWLLVEFLHGYLTICSDCYILLPLSLQKKVWAELGKITPNRGLGANPKQAGEFIMLESWPEIVKELRNTDIEDSMNRVQNVVRAIRNIRAKF